MSSTNLSAIRVLAVAATFFLTGIGRIEGQAPAPQNPQTPSSAQSVARDAEKPLIQLTSHDYLERARTILNSIPDKPKGEDADEVIADLKRHFAAMLALYQNETPPPAATTETTPVKNWKDVFSEIERDIVKLIGAGSSLGPATAGAAVATSGQVVSPPAAGAAAPAAGQVVSPPAGAAVPAPGQVAEPNVGLLGVAAAAKVSTIGIEDLDPEVRKQTERFRTEVELFFTKAESEAARTVQKEIK